MSSAILSDRGVLAVAGEDARDFLQGVITNDIRQVAPGKAVFSALLTPQGKYLFEFFITQHESELWLETDKAHIPELLKRLTMYRLRAKVSFEHKGDVIVAACWGDGTVPASVIAHYTDPRHAMLGTRVLAKQADEIYFSIDDYDLHRLTLGIPEGGKDLTPERSLLLEYGYDHLHAVDFTKGCYVGQEVTARSKHRATLHKYIHQVTSETLLPPAGTPVMLDGKQVGEMCSSVGMIGLAILRTQDVAGKTPSAGEAQLRIHLPQWLPAATQ